MPKPNRTINISVSSILKVFGLLLAIFFLYLIRDVLAILFVAIIFAAAIEPWVDWLQSKRIPRPLSIVGVYVLSFGVVAIVLVMLIPAMAREFNSFAQNFPDYYQNIAGAIQKLEGQSVTSQDLRSLLGSWAANLGGTTRGIFSTLSGIFGGIFFLFAVLVITFYLIVKRDNMKHFLKMLTPVKYQPYVMQLYLRVQKKIGSWLRGQIVLMFVIGILCYLGLLSLGVEYALLLGMIAGLTEIIPYLGPIIGAVPAVLLAFTQSPLLALLTIALYVIVQQLENNLIVPKIMKKAVGLNPLVVIVVILIGGKVAGVVGALIAVPVATAISVVVKDFIDLKKTGEIKVEEE